MATALNVLLLTVATSPATAAPIPGAFSFSVSERSIWEPTFDGTDMFWVGDKLVRARWGDSYNTSIRRQSIVGGPAVDLFTSFARDDDEIEHVAAGGGFIAFLVRNDSFEGDTGTRTRVMRIAPDGTGLQVIAEGALTHPEFHQSRQDQLSDCGTSVTLEDVSPSGEVIFGTAVRSRKGRDCGGTENRNDWTFTGVKPDGSSRVITTSSARIRYTVRRKKGRVVTTSCNCSAGSLGIDVEGDWALVSSGGWLSRAAGRLINLTTGMQSDNYSVGYLGRAGGVMASHDKNGRAVVFGIKPIANRKRKGKKRTYRIQYRTLSFPAPGDPNSSVPVIDEPFAMYCGERLFGINAKAGSAKLYEFDPNTGAQTREFGDIPKNWSLERCTSTHFFLSKPNARGSKTRIFAVPLA